MSHASPRPSHAPIFDFEPPAPMPRSARSCEVAAHFQLKNEVPTRKRRARCPIAPPTAGELMLITGASGSGKSSLLRAVRRNAARAGTQTINFRRILLPERPVIDLFEDQTLASTLKRLARVGLAEVWTWLRLTSELSEGQRWRLRLALAIHRAETSSEPLLLICDEFAAVLDRITACVVASVLRRAIDSHKEKLAAIVATSHDDLFDALEADVTVDCDFGQIEIVRRAKGGAR